VETKKPVQLLGINVLGPLEVVGVVKSPGGMTLEDVEAPATLRSAGGLPPRASSLFAPDTGPAVPKTAGLGVFGARTPPLDVEGAHRRYLAALLGPARVCDHCGSLGGVALESARTAYHYEGVRGAPEDPNRPVPLCRECAVEHHAHWDEMWAEYHASLL
jgi:hypothetical protein